MFYKIVHIPPFFRSYRVSFVMEPHRELGWSKNFLGSRYLTLPATPAETLMAWRSKPSHNPPIRMITEEVPCVPTIGGDYYTEVVRYKPNRHQRKRSLDEILAVLNRMQDAPVSESKILW